MAYIAVTIDVTDALPAEVRGGARISIAAWIFPADPDKAPVIPTTITLLNGGSYDKRYFHFEVPGEQNFSVAEALAAKGHLVILPDHLGVSESSRLPNEAKGTREIAALANHAAISEIYQRLVKGSLSPELPPMPEFVRVGGGHSMGGFQTITQQAKHKTYDRIMVIGYTAIGVHIMVDGKPEPLEKFWDDSRGEYWLLDHTAKSDSFHWPDVSAEVRAVDAALAVEVPRTLSRQSVTVGIISEDAGKIDVPVYICLGETDVSPRPHDEPHYYSASADVTLHILPHSGHCQSFASTRMQMINRIDGWIRSFTA